MSASACIAFYGFRFEMPPESVEDLLEDRADTRIEAATKAKLDVYWANFGGENERYLLFIGKKLSFLGAENALEFAISPKELEAIMASTNERLDSAALGGSPQLFLQWEEDV